MRAALARLLRAIADRLAGQSERDADLARIRLLEIDNGHWRRRAESESRACERYIAERDDLAVQLDAVRDQSTFWLRASGDLSEALILQGEAARRRPSADVARPVFGRRNPPSHLRPVE